MTGIEAARAIAQLPVDDEARAGEPPALARLPRSSSSPPTTSTRSRPSSRGVVDYVLKPAERERLQVTVDRVSKAPRASAGQRRRARCERGMQRPAAEAGREDEPGRGAALELDPGDGGHQHPDDPGRGRAVLHLRREVHARCRPRTLEALIRKPIKELVDELDAEHVLADPPLDARQRAGASPASAATCAAASWWRCAVTPKSSRVSRSYAGLFRGCEATPLTLRRTARRPAAAQVSGRIRKSGWKGRPSSPAPPIMQAEHARESSPARTATRRG